MRKDRNIHDKLNTPAHLYYQPKALKRYDMPPDVAELNLIAARHELIQEAKKHSWNRRTYHNTYVTHSPDHSTKCANIDNIEQMQLRGFEIVESYSTDDYGDNCVQAFIAQLPGKHHAERWVYGYNYSDWDGATIYLTICDKDEAKRWAKDAARYHAELCYDDWVNDQREQKRMDIKDSPRASRELIRAQIKVYRAFKVDALKDILRSLLAQHRQLVKDYEST